MTSASRRPARVLLIQLRRLGDVLLTTPLLDDLHAAFPSARTDFLVGRAAAPLLEGLSLGGERIVYDRDRPWAMARRIRERCYDWIVDVQSNPRTAMLSRLSGAPIRVGWQVRGWAWVYTHLLSRTGRPIEYVVRERRRLLELLGVPPLDTRPRLMLTAAERAAGEERLRVAGALPGVARVGLVLSSGEPTREWRVEGFATVADSIAAAGLKPIIFQNPGDDEKVARLRSLSSAGIVAAIPDLREFLGALSSCRALVSGDTGPAHMAAALGVPTVTIYGSQSAVAWNPGLPTSLALQGRETSAESVLARLFTLLPP
ncbi:MAG: glycosyltransferase family 9 protein [Gemmatimonadota bacterium]|nr:glycosyltransferase family 9 protein [Gemmatimonadota bacterium]